MGLFTYGIMNKTEIQTKQRDSLAIFLSLLSFFFSFNLPEYLLANNNSFHSSRGIRLAQINHIRESFLISKSFFFFKSRLHLVTH